MARETVIWPSYLDAKKTRKEGRRIARARAVPSPTLKEILSAAEELGFESRRDPERAYPREWWGQRGRILVSEAPSKETLLRDVAGIIKKHRS